MPVGGGRPNPPLHPGLRPRRHSRLEQRKQVVAGEFGRYARSPVQTPEEKPVQPGIPAQDTGDKKFNSRLVAPTWTAVSLSAKERVIMSEDVEPFRSGVLRASGTSTYAGKPRSPAC